MDSTGVPHILEHTALCGSAKYPVRDPFFKMLNRSLSTFMNAMTGNKHCFTFSLLSLSKYVDANDNILIIIKKIEPTIPSQNRIIRFVSPLLPQVYNG